MCGIAGEVSFRERPGDVEKMLDAIVHRGPDDSGLYTDDRTQLGFRRLAIVDLSAAGHQPMTNESETLWLVFNGEVYNYRALTAELQALGHQFRSQTDSEVVLHAYEQWGIACVRRFNGMFAFALWDTQRRRLFAARDRFGVKPFYVARTPQGGLLFASEIKALFRHPRAPRPAPHDDRLFDFLVDGRLDHTNTTCLAGVDQLPASHTRTVTEGHNDFQRYWDLPDGPPQPWRTPDERALRRLTDEFAHLLEDSIRLRLHADVPVGSCLSGGLDSSAIVSMANRLLFSDETDVPWHARGDRQKTFSACYDDLRHDERAYIEQVVAATGADAHYTFPGESDIAQAVIPRVVWHQDEPFGSTSIVAQWHVMAAAHQRGIKVMLDGQGADELLGGYHGFFGPALVDELLSGNPAQFLRNALLYRRNHHPSFNHVARSMAYGLLPPGSP
ncbi:MAG: hypothetical protein JWO42_1906, partial [Chloroflexi bacterium]|nr:hypothetical protein [Chloroflexota bacterium]